MSRDVQKHPLHQKSNSKYYYLGSFWMRVINFSFTFSIVNVFNFGSSVSIKIHVPSKDYVGSMIRKLPLVCKYTVVHLWRVVHENCVWLAGQMTSVQRKYEEKGRQERQEPGEKAQKTYRQYQQRYYEGRLRKYVGSLKWTPIPISLGFLLLAYQHYRRVLRGTADPNKTVNVQLAKDWEVTCYRMVPLRAFSRAWGWAHSINLPIWARSPLYNWYADAFHCNIYEAEEEDLRQYNNLGEFFRRGLKAGVRPVCCHSSVVSPVDGTILQCGKVEYGNVEQVKGVSYSLPAFLGPQNWSHNNNNYNNQQVDKQQYCSGLLKNKNTTLFHCVIYLAPGDYHRFHSPAQWNVSFRRHFAGELLSVNPIIARWIAGLFSLNERAVYVGEWEYGFFSYTAVGATNVGSIKVYEDKELVTNCWRLKKNTYRDKRFSRPITLEKGDNFGEFNLGSTIVLLFEAPLDFEFAASTGSTIRLGESLFKSKGRTISAQGAVAEANPSL